MATRPVTPNETRFPRQLVIGLGAGSGMALLTLALQFAKPEAKPIVEAALHWGPLFVIVLLGMQLAHSTINTWGQQFMSAATDNAKALQSMADAMQRISQREDERERERELVLDHLAVTTQLILNKLESMESRYPEKSFTQAAGGPR